MASSPPRSPAKGANDNSDSDLDDLLDDALKDFKKTNTPSSEEFKDTDKDWTSDFLRASATARLGGTRTPPNSYADPSFLHAAYAKAPTASEPLEEAVRRMQSEAQSTPGDVNLESLLSGMRLDPAQNPLGAAGGLGVPTSEADLVPMMQQMMKSLLSKDLLYPAIKDLADKYPEWLAANRPPSITQEEFDRYNKQFEITKRICHAYEEEDGGGSEKEEVVMDLMQQMQALGNPPKDLVGDAGPPGLGGGGDVEFDADGNPVLPKELQEQCKVS